LNNEQGEEPFPQSDFDRATEVRIHGRAWVYSGPVLELFLIEDFAGFGPAKS